MLAEDISYGRVETSVIKEDTFVMPHACYITSCASISNSMFICPSQEDINHWTWCEFSSKTFCSQHHCIPRNKARFLKYLHSPWVLTVTHSLLQYIIFARLLSAHQCPLAHPSFILALHCLYSFVAITVGSGHISSDSVSMNLIVFLLYQYDSNSDYANQFLDLPTWFWLHLCKHVSASMVLLTSI